MKATRRGHHYHLESCPSIAGRDCEEATPAVIAKRGLEPCEICHPDSAMGMGGFAGPSSSAVVGGGSPAGGEAVEDDFDVPFLNDAENAALRLGVSVDDVPHGVTDAGVLREIVDKYGTDGLARIRMIQDLPDAETALDATDPRNESAFAEYDMASASRHGEGMVSGGLAGLRDGMRAPQCGMPSGEFELTMEDIDRIMERGEALGLSLPETDDDQDRPEPLPRWGGPTYHGSAGWYDGLRYATDDPMLASQVAAQVAPAMEKWPTETQDMLYWAVSNGFMTDPASTRFHLCTPGGLACHSASVADMAVRMMELPENEAARAELGDDWREITQVVALWHDACKVGYYAPLPERNPANGAFYTVADNRKGDKRHGDLSADIVRRFYGSRLPEVAYTAISLHMGTWDYRREPDDWIKRRCDAEARARSLAKTEEIRADQDDRIRQGRLWPQLHQQMEGCRDASKQIEHLSGESAAHAIAMATGGNMGRMIEGLISDTYATHGGAMAREQMDMLVSEYKAAREASDEELAMTVVRVRRMLEDRDDAEKQRRARQKSEEARKFTEWADRQYEEHPFVKLIHEADKRSSDEGR